MNTNTNRSKSKSLKATFFTFLASFWCAAPVWADDLEIFFGDVIGSDVRPNVMFIIDTSGSMSGTVSGTGKDRLDNVKDAMYQLLDELNNVNVGLMRFTNPGGPVLYPVSYIDQDVDAGSIVAVESSVSSSSDDAQEFESTSLVILDDVELELVELTVGSSSTFADQISDDDDDAEEWVNTGSNWEDSNDLDFNAGTNAIRTGVRFRGSDVPRGATITNAYMRFTGYRSGNSLPVPMRIYGEEGDGGELKDNGSYDIRDRAETSAYVDWNITTTIAGNQTIDTPNIASVVQEMIEHSSWNGPDGENDDMVFVIQPYGPSTGGLREFYARDGSKSRAPRLFIEYYEGAPPTSGLTRAGLRFTNLQVPRGATVTDAKITFTASRDFSSTYALSIDAESSGNAPTFTDATGNVSGRTLTGSSVGWAGTLSASSSETFSSPDIGALVQSITDRTDWCGGNALALVISGTEGLLPVASFDESGSLAPRLTVNYEYDSVVPGASCAQRTISRTVNNSSDDAEEVGSSVSTTSGDLDLLSGSVTGVRFRDIPVAPGTTVSAAYIELTADADDSGTTTMQIFAESSANAQTYASVNGAIEGRSYFGSGVTWTETTAWKNDGVYRSPNLAAMVTSVVGQPDWKSGNAMAFRINASTSTDREAESYDGSPGQSPRLVLEFQDDGSGFSSRRVRNVLIDQVSQLNHNGWTPVQDTLYEAARYYTGMSALWGKTRGDKDIDGGPFGYARVSAAESMVPGTFKINRPENCKLNDFDDNDCEDEYISGIGGQPMYQSPINNFCQEQSHIIMLTDGQANRPHSAGLIRDFMGKSCANAKTVNADGSLTSLTDGEKCVKDLAKYMNENDMSSTLTGRQRITTHTIGFNFSSKWLADVAAAGGGVYKTANNATELVAEIKDIIGEVLKTDSTFVAPVAAVNEFNQLSHLSQVYFAVFRPDEFPRWRGNLKKYALSSDGKGDIIDVGGALAVDPATGFFLDTSRSFWSPALDGAAVDLGGAASQAPGHASRNLFTYHSGSTTSVLSASENSIDASNTNLTKAMFDVTTMSDPEFADHLNWIRGKDTEDENADGNTSENRYIFGDPVHSRPIAITYGGTATNPDVEIFFGSNSGTIHAINAANGQERFAFMPEELMPLQKTLRTNSATSGHPYGMDGTITRWSNDQSRDGISPSDPGDYVRIYTGMRRGGSSYYALDVTDRVDPELMWHIKGGQVQGNGDDFSELGQSWSRPIKTQIALAGDTAGRDVLLFSGGYDETQDDKQVQTADSVGRSMYMVDAVTGRLIWAGGKTGVANMDESFSAMSYSFPSTMSVVDINQDGLADMWFAGDTGGQLWRFDINNGQPLANLVTGGVIGDLGVAGGTNSIGNNRRFFASPSVALIKGPDGPELAVALGSGFRPSPLSVLATNRMFVLRQKDVFSAPSSYQRLTLSDLYNATSNTLKTATGDDLVAEQEALYNSQGWYFNLPYTGEKVLSSPLIVNERIVFTTYTPGSSAGTCKPAAGTSRAYAVSLENAVRDDPEVLLTPSIVDQATVILPPPPDPNEPDDPNDPNDPDDPNEPTGPCPNGNAIEIKLNAEDGPIDEWCNDASTTYWMKER